MNRVSSGDIFQRFHSSKHQGSVKVFVCRNKFDERFSIYLQAKFLLLFENFTSSIKLAFLIQESGSEKENLLLCYNRI